MKITLLLLTAFISFPVQAQDGLCSSFSSYTGSVMSARQGGVGIQTIIDVTKGTEIEGSAMAIISDAYSVPIYSLKENKKLAVNEFTTKYYLICLEGL